MFAVVWHVRLAEIICALITFLLPLTNKVDKVIVSGSKWSNVYSQFQEYRPCTIKVLYISTNFIVIPHSFSDIYST